MFIDKYGFTLNAPLTLQQWRPIEMGAAVPFEEQRACPCDDTPLLRFAEHRSMQNEKTIRLGWCSVCNYLGFIDRPTIEWMVRFYASGMWDSNKVRETSRAIFHGNGVLTLLLQLPVDRAHTICDVGCGYGEALLFLKERGFQNLSGVEYSPHRARTARALGFRMVEGEEERAASTVLMNHVLEHLSDPRSAIEKISRAQRAGDYIIIAVPNVWGEACMEILSFLPHLHAFSVVSLKVLCGRFGYEAVLQKESGKEIVLAFKKTGNTRVVPQTFSIEPMLQKFIRGLGLAKTYLRKNRRLWWFRKADVGGQTLLFRNRRLDALYWKSFSFFANYIFRKKVARSMGTFSGQRGLQSIAVSDMPHSAHTFAPLTIFYHGSIVLFYK